MIGKIHKVSGQTIFACCDKELVDTEIKEKDLTLKISSSFYGISEMCEKEVLDNISEATQINVFGKKICALLVSKNIVPENIIIYFGDVPHLQIYNI